MQLIIWTDDHALGYILNIADARDKLARWPLRLMELEFNAACRDSVKNSAVDPLGGLPKTRTDNKNIDNKSSVVASLQQSAK